ncbi:MAG: zinc transporter ZntB [Hyphomicrobiales bacterium]|nr:MAG: zinc transporter ZntB [Hyphomicrobiales bacterium]
MDDTAVIFSHRLGEGGPLWTHLDVNRPGARDWLEAHEPALEPLVINALLAEDIRPRTLEIDQRALVILRGVNLNAESAPEDMVSIRIYADAGWIVSTQKRQLQAVLDIERKIIAGSGPDSTGGFLNLLLIRLLDRMEPVFTNLDESIDDIEESLLDSADIKQRNAIVQVRKTAIILRRHMAPLRDAIRQLWNLDLDWLDVAQKRHLLENHDRITRYVEDLDTIRERAQIVKDELANMLADRLNHNTYILSVVAAIFLPLGFLTGLLGINVGGIPGADVPWAFWAFSAILAVLVLALVWVFRHLKWF